MGEQNVVCEISKKEISSERAKQGFTIRPSILQLIQNVSTNFSIDSWISDDELNKFKAQYVHSLVEQDKGKEDEIRMAVAKAISEHDFMTKNFADTINENDDDATLGQRMADRVAEFGGSWFFIITFFALITTWIVVNIFLKSNAFDAYPFIFLNLVLSCLASIQAPIIMMSQNRASEKDRTRALNDFKVNLKNEIEIMFLREKIDHIINNQNPHIHETLNFQSEMMEEIKTSLSK